MTEFGALMIVLFLSGSALLASLLCLKRPNPPKRKYDIDEIVKKTPWHRLDKFKGKLPAEERLDRTEANGLGDTTPMISPDQLSEIELASILREGPQLLWHEQGAHSRCRLVSQKDAVRLNVEGWKEITDYQSGHMWGPTK